MLRMELRGIAAILLLILVQNAICDAGTHLSSPRDSKTSCQSTTGLEGGSEDSFCQSEDPNPSKDSGHHGVRIDETVMNPESLYFSLFSAFLVGLTGVLPLFLSDPNKHPKMLNRFLSFAVGSILGDVFLHLLPETWDIKLAEGETAYSRSKMNGLLVMVGLLLFCILEKLFPDKDNESVPLENQAVNHDHDDQADHDNQSNNDVHPDVAENPKPQNIKTAGFLNLVSNFSDNFTHGLAIGGSYLVSFQVGLMTTLGLLLHEIPHEFGDFAFLLWAGYTHQQAANRQLLTASGGLLGVIFVHLVGSDSSVVAWILPFTSGGFMYIALSTIVPDLVKESESRKESIIHLLLMVFGVCVMAAVGCWEQLQ